MTVAVIRVAVNSVEDAKVQVTARR